MPVVVKNAEKNIKKLMTKIIKIKKENNGPILRMVCIKRNLGASMRGNKYMKTTTISLPPPLITKYFDPYLLDRLLGMYKKVQNRIIPLSKKKIRDQDVGKKKEFMSFLEKFYEEYERKKIEEAEYKEKIKNYKKRSSLPNTAETFRFKRFQS
ncbi:MAG TPA: hypothetical protein VHZ50_16475 [Puia sp.]|nr:hypothetical protein [Puia sp.]